MAIQFGIVGFGAMGRWHGDAIRRTRGLALRSVCDITPQCRAAAKKLGATAHADLAEFLADDELDAVAIATPSHAHVAPILAALKAGKHVLCDKPLVQTEREARRVFAAAERADRHLMTFQNRREDVPYRTAAKVVASGKLGELHEIRMIDWWYSNVMTSFGVKGYRPGWRTEAAFGGGMLMDFGPHHVDQLLCLVPEPVTSVHCLLAGRKWTTDADDHFILTICFANGPHAVIEVSSAAQAPLNITWALTGSAGGFRWENDQAKLYSHTASGKLRTRVLPSAKGDWDAVYRNFRDAVAGKTELMVQPHETLRLFRVLDAARRSAANGKVVTVQDDYAARAGRAA